MLKFFEKFANKIYKFPPTRAITKGLLYMMPLTLIGAVVLALLNLPIPAFQSFMMTVFGQGWSDVCLVIYNATLNIMSFIALITVSYAMAQEKKAVQAKEVSAVNAVIVAVACYIAITQQIDGTFDLSKMNASGMLTSMLVALFSTNILFAFDELMQKLSRNRRSAFDNDLHTRQAFRILMPAVITLLLFAILRVILNATDLVSIIDNAVSSFATRLLSSGTLLSALLTVFLTQVLWLFGIHGGNFLIENIPQFTLEASAAGTIVTKEFLDVFVFIGGAGATLGLLVALLIWGRKNHGGRIARVSLFTGIFNINEPMLYGLPIVFNPFFLAPFILVPIALTLISYFATALNLVPAVAYAVDWTTPVFLSGFIGTQSFAGLLLQLVNLAAAVFMYAPFVRIFNKHQQQLRMSNFEELKRILAENDPGGSMDILGRGDEIGALARDLVHEIRTGLSRGQIPLHLEYQPKVTAEKQVFGAEALLRWQHPVFGYVPPIVPLRLCDEAKLSNELGTWIIEQAIGQLKEWNNEGYTHLRMSINLDPMQLRNDAELVGSLRGILEGMDVEPDYIELELTENVALNTDEHTRGKLAAIRELGLNISIDDLGMGHGSLTYLSDFYANVVKIDASVIKGIANDHGRQEIVRTIVDLCAHLGVQVIVEGVETEAQLNTLVVLGCCYFQGFYFSRSLSKDLFIEYVNEHGFYGEYKIGNE